MKNLILLAFAISLLSCSSIKNSKISQGNAPETDSTFQFTIRQPVNFIDSKQGIYKRDYLARKRCHYSKKFYIEVEKKGHKKSWIACPGPAHFTLTKEEKERIESIYFSERLDTLPDKYVPSFKTVFPFLVDEFVIYYKGKKKSFIYNCDYICTESKDRWILDKIKIFSDYVIKTILEKEEVKKLPPSNRFFI